MSRTCVPGAIGRSVVEILSETRKDLPSLFQVKPAFSTNCALARHLQGHTCMVPLSHGTLNRCSRTEQLQAWVAAEHARLHLVAEWPDSIRKESVLMAIRSSIRRLMIDPDAAAFRCVVCRTGEPPSVRPFTHRPKRITHRHEIAA